MGYRIVFFVLLLVILPSLFSLQRIVFPDVTENTDDRSQIKKKMNIAGLDSVTADRRPLLAETIQDIFQAAPDKGDNIYDGDGEMLTKRVSDYDYYYDSNNFTRKHLKLNFMFIFLFLNLQNIVLNSHQHVRCCVKCAHKEVLWPH